ncbi:MAG: LbtU family siderophore porin [Desulfobacterales bacterium]|nr:LbtU family siderophore porin [Desulfobacterales bacterium]
MKQIYITLCAFMALTWNTALADTQQELEKRVAALESQLAEKQAETGSNWSDRITLSGTIELDYSYTADDDVSDKTKENSNSDLSLGTVELGLEAQLHQWVTANVLLKGEDLDDSDGEVKWDEVFVTFQNDAFPVYAVAGKRYQPFGAYESLFINDPVTQDLYEVNETGLTLGYTDQALMGLDVSVTVYKGETLINRVTDAEYGWERNTAAGYTETDTLNSYIISAAIAPTEGMHLSVFFNSEPGDSDRNSTLGAAVHWDGFGFTADAEYIGALERELHRTDNREYKEKAWTLSLGYQVMEALQLALRYEGFDSDRDNAGDLENRYSAGLTYTVLETDNLTTSLMGEYRRSNYETKAGSNNNEDLDEFFARLALEF